MQGGREARAGASPPGCTAHAGSCPREPARWPTGLSIAQLQGTPLRMADYTRWILCKWVVRCGRARIRATGMARA
eukprot:scaffold7374_cov112-Isochrysis_galbana.AAC.25